MYFFTREYVPVRLFPGVSNISPKVRAGRIKAVYSSYPLAPEIRARWDERITFFLSEPPPPERRTKLEIISRLSFGEIVYSLSRVSFHSPWQSSDGVGIEASLGFDIESGSSDARDVNTVFIRNNEASRDA